MTDRLLNLAQQPAARKILQNIGLPTPVALKRAKGAYADKPLAGEKAITGAAGKGYASATVGKTLQAAGAETVGSVDALGEEDKLDAVVFDATAVTSATDLRALYDFFNPLMGRIGKNARVVVITGLPEKGKDSAQSAAFRALEGFTKSLAKEIGKRGATANLFYLEKGAEDRLAMPLRFFLSGHSAYVDGQPVRITKTAKAPAETPLTGTLNGKVALVTGAARGIGAATAKRLAAEGAQVIGLDIPADEQALNETMGDELPNLHNKLERTEKSLEDQIKNGANTQQALDEVRAQRRAELDECGKNKKTIRDAMNNTEGVFLGPSAPSAATASTGLAGSCPPAPAVRTLTWGSVGVQLTGRAASIRDTAWPTTRKRRDSIWSVWPTGFAVP